MHPLWFSPPIRPGADAAARAGEATERASVRAPETSAARGIYRGPAPFCRWRSPNRASTFWGDGTREIATSHQNLISDAAEELTAAAVRAFNHPRFNPARAPCTRRSLVWLAALACTPTRCPAIRPRFYHAVAMVPRDPAPPLRASR
jgi:hypothetical protein